LSNEEIFEEAGLDIEDPPETYEEAAEYAKTIKEETGKYGYFVSLDLSLPIQHMEMMDVLVTNDDGTAAFNTDEGVAVIEYFTELHEEDLIHGKRLYREQREGTDFYQSECVSFGTDCCISEIDENAPDVFDKTVPSQAITGDSGKKMMSVQ